MPHPVAVDARLHRDEPLDDLELAHLHGEERDGLLLGERGVRGDVERERGLAEARPAGEDDEVRLLEPAGLLVERLEAGRDADLLVLAAGHDLLGEELERDAE